MKIISFEQFEKNQIPSLEDFGLASDLFLEKILSKNSDNIKGVLRHGNVSNPKFSSDIDFLISTKDRSSDELIRLATIEVFDNYFVPVEPRVISEFQIDKKIFTLNSSYALALEKGDVLFGENPLLGIKFNETVQISAADSIMHYYLKLKNSYTEAIPSYMMAESILNKVKHTMINAVKFKFNEHVQNESELLEKYLEVIGSKKLMVDEIKDVVEFKKYADFYNDILVERKKSVLTNRDKNDYHYIIAAMVGKYGAAMNLIERTLDAINKK